MNLNKFSTAELAKRYLWFISTGVKHPTLNDPDVILCNATPEHVDQLIQEGMKRWPSPVDYNKGVDYPKGAA